MPKSAKAFRESLKKSGVFYTPKKLAEFMRSFFQKDAIVCWLEHYRDGFNPLDFIDDMQKILNEAKRNLAEKGIHRKI